MIEDIRKVQSELEEKFTSEVLTIDAAALALYEVNPEMAREIVKSGEGDIIEAHVKLLSQIGRPITNPWVNSIELIPADNVNFDSIRKVAEEVSTEKLSKQYFIDLRKRLIAGEVQVF